MRNSGQSDFIFDLCHRFFKFQPFCFTLVLILIYWDLFPQDFIRNGVVIRLLIFVFCSQHSVRVSFLGQKNEGIRILVFSIRIPLLGIRKPISVFGFPFQVFENPYQYSDTQHSRKFLFSCGLLLTLIEPESCKTQNIKVVDIPLVFPYQFESEQSEFI